jgi:hypothetical protein
MTSMTMRREEKLLEHAASHAVLPRLKFESG